MGKFFCHGRKIKLPKRHKVYMAFKIPDSATGSNPNPDISKQCGVNITFWWKNSASFHCVRFTSMSEAQEGEKKNLIPPNNRPVEISQ